MLFKLKKVNEGLDRIFIVISVLAMLFGFWKSSIYYREISSTTWRSPLWQELTEKLTADELLQKAYDSLCSKKGKRVLSKEEQEAQNQTEMHKNKLLAMGYSVSEKYNGTLLIEPPKVNVIIVGIIFGVLTFFVFLFSLRGLMLLVIWISQGFNENRQ